MYVAVVVYLDALLTSESAHLELCRALHACAHNPSPLRLHIRRLDTTALGVVRIIVLLELLQPQVLTPICCHQLIQIKVYSHTSNVCNCEFVVYRARCTKEEEEQEEE